MSGPGDGQTISEREDRAPQGAAAVAESRRPSGWSAQPPPWTRRLILWIILSVAAAMAAYWFLSKIRHLIYWLVLSLFLSFALEPAVNWLHRHGWRRGAATGLLLLALFLFGVLLVAVMVPVVIKGVLGIIQGLPDWLERASRYTDRWFGVKLSSKSLLDSLKSAGGDVRSFASNVAGNVLGFGAAVLGGIFQAATVGLFTFYLVAEAPRVRRAICSLFPAERQGEVLTIWESAIEKTGGFFYSRLLLAIINGGLIFIVMWVLGVPYAAPLAFFQGVVSEFIPIVGTYIAGGVPILVALATKSVGVALALLVYVVVYQQIENYVLAPRISARTMQLHPAVAFFAAIAGASVGGLIGAFLALPAAAVIQAAASTYVGRHEVIESDLTREGGDAAPGAAPPGRAAKRRRRWRRER